MFSSLSRSPLLVCLCLAVVIVSLPVLADEELPRLGENASFNLKKEDDIGKGLYLKLKEQGYVIDDPLLSRYLSDIGISLLSSLDIQLRDYHFYLVKDDSINAFAMPGGYVGVNVGLIAASRSEDELASVLAHEIAHVELRHGMQMLEKSEQVNVAGMVAILAAIVVGGQDPDLAGALIFSSAAGSTQALINFTRGNEYEADRMGINLLQQSDYDPSAMLDFMKLLQAREQSGELSNIEYIRTHPINSNRIAEIQARLEQLKKKEEKSRRFNQFKDYLLYIYPVEAQAVHESRFYQALDLTRHGQYQLAEKIYLQLVEEDPDSIWFRYALAENYLFKGDREKAKSLYRDLLKLYPDDFTIGEKLAELLLDQGDAGQALTLINQQLGYHEKQVKLYQLLVNAHHQLGNKDYEKLAEADFHWYSGNKKRAKTLYKSLLEDGKLNVAEQARIKEKLNGE